MGMILAPQFLSPAATAGYVVPQSMLFDAATGERLLKTWAGSGSLRRSTVFGWFKRSGLGTTQTLWSSRDPGTDDRVEFTSGDKLLVRMSNFPGSTIAERVTTRVFRDVTGWFHLTVALDFDRTDDHCIRIWVNGAEVTGFDTKTNLSSAQDFGTWNQAYTHAIGCMANSLTTHYDGYATQLGHLDGTAVSDPEAAGLARFDTSGVWIPVDVSGVVPGTGHDYLLDGSSATDQSGAGNDWTNDTVTFDHLDSPTDDLANAVMNYPTFNALFNHPNSTLSDGGRKHAISSWGYHAFLTQPLPTSGKVYFEVKATNVGAYANFRMMFARQPNSDYITTQKALTSAADYWHVETTVNEQLRVNGATANYGNLPTTQANGAVWGCAYDADNNAVWFHLNGVWVDGDGADGSATVLAEIEAGTTTSAARVDADIGEDGWFFTAGGDSASSYVAELQIDPGDWTYAAPSGFAPWGTASLPAPAVADPSRHHQVALVSHDGIGTGFALNWDADSHDTLFIIKRRDGAAEQWYWVNGLRGYDRYVSSDSANVETTDANVISVNGSTVTLGPKLAAAGYVVQCHRAGAAGGVSNTDGSTTTTVSANAATGFALLTYSGTGAAATIGHGLGISPANGMAIFKNLTQVGQDWIVGGMGMSFASDQYAFLNQTSAMGAVGARWNTTDPTDAVIAIGTGGENNGNGHTILGIVWAPVEGYSAFGSFEGNGGADGPAVDSGGRPETVLYKNLDVGSTDWAVADAERSPDNVVDRLAFPSSAEAESMSIAPLDLLATGFKVRGTAVTVNGSANTIGYAVFNAVPFANEGTGQARAG